MDYKVHTQKQPEVKIIREYKTKYPRDRPIIIGIDVSGSSYIYYYVIEVQKNVNLDFVRW